MSKYRVGVIGAGDKSAKKSVLGYAMAYEHAQGYVASGECELVAVADIRADRAGEFAATYGIGPEGVFSDYQAMLASAELDIVSICTWMKLHEPMAVAAVEAGVKAIHCEKPMADTWGGARRMAAAAQAAGVQLTFNHQRRYGAPFQMAKKLLDDGAIGELVRFECEFGNLYDTGTHFIDMLSFFNGEQPAKWVIGQVDYRTENLVFGAHCENQQVVLFEYANGVHGFVYSGAGENRPLGVINRLIGTEGVIDVGRGHGHKEALRWRRQGEADWSAVDTGGESIHGPHFIERAVADVVDCLKTGRKCMLDASNALIATEIIFGAYESSRRRGRVDLPLEIDDNPLAAMVASGDLAPAPPA